LKILARDDGVRPCEEIGEPTGRGPGVSRSAVVFDGLAPEPESGRVGFQ
jgi:hypothetical protein